MMVCLCNTSIERCTCTSVSYLGVWGFLKIFTSIFKESQADEYLHLEDHMFTRGCEVTWQVWWSTFTICKNAEQHKMFIDGRGLLSHCKKKSSLTGYPAASPESLDRLIWEVTLPATKVSELGKLTATLVKTSNIFFTVEESSEQKGHLLIGILLLPLDRSHAGRKKRQECNNFPC